MRIGVGMIVAMPASSDLRGLTPLLATITAALVPDALTSRGIQPSKPSPLVNTTLASASFFASAGDGA